MTSTVEWVDRPTKHQTYNATDKGRARRRAYRHGNSKWDTDASYLSREFVAYDGEGITLPDGSHIYVMFGDSKGGYIADVAGLTSARILAFLLERHAAYPDAIHCIYGGSYDFNMWLSNASQGVVYNIYERDYSRFGEYLIQWRRGKSFYLKVANGDAVGVTIYDVISFFQCAFVKACDDYLGEEFTHRDVIVANKALRSGFTEADIPTMREYMGYELVNTVKLMNELRRRLNSAGLRPRRWDGPGAVAAALLAREGVKASLTRCPDDVQTAARHAYFGGRFEPVQYGAVYERAYEYDVNSAYPYALLSVPNLTRGQWVYDDNPAPTDGTEFTLFHVRFHGADYRLPMPLPWRSSRGNVVYPGDGAFYGWYWSPDVYAAQEYVARYGGSLDLRSAWRFVEDNPEDRPFAFIAELYHKRQVMKAAGDGAHVGIKLALNSLYGKLAQQVGARFTDGEGWRIPPFHQLEFAGYVTATCRSMVYRAAIDDLSKVIAYETDALFTTEPLTVPIGTGLGDWEATTFDSLTYAQSGVYFGSVDGVEFAKTRGVNLGTLTRDMVERAMQRPDARDRHAEAPLTQFITAGQALQGQWGKWRRWITSTKSLEVEPQGKRIPLPGAPFGEWGRTFAARVPHESHSQPFPIMWVNPDVGMEELEELRNMGTTEFEDMEGG